MIQESTPGTVPSAQNAVSAQTATTAQTATVATAAEEADDAVTLDGFSAAQPRVRCAEGTNLYGGMCWDDAVRPIRTWLGASIERGFGFRCLFYRAN